MKNNKGNNFLCIKTSQREKIGWFWFDLRFCTHEIFSQKNKTKQKNWFEIVLITSFTMLLIPKMH